MPEHALPSGTGTFVFTDFAVSTRTREQEPEAMRLAVACHDVIVRSAVESNVAEITAALNDPELAV